MNNLLFLAPVLPSPTGNGLSMRAYASLRALSEHSHVYLLVLNKKPVDKMADRMIRSLCREVVFYPAGLWQGRQFWLRAISMVPFLGGWLYPRPSDWSTLSRVVFKNPFSVSGFDCVHLFRMYMIPLLSTIKGSATWRQAQLDIDDLESLTRARLAALYFKRGLLTRAAQLRLESRQYLDLEKKELGVFDRVFVSSEDDRRRLVDGGLYPAPEVAPNVVDIPDVCHAATESSGDEFRFLFVGSLSYFPNVDAITRFSLQVLPAIRAAADRPVGLDIVGGGLKPRIGRQLSRCPGVRLRGYLPNIADAYRVADAVVVPLSGGGGTRIKVLEAFAYGRCVVSTPLGVEGIELDVDRHVVVGEGVEGLLAASLSVVRDPALRRSRAEHARLLVQERYSQTSLGDVLRCRGADIVEE